MQRKWTVRLITALLWALAAASAVYWALRIGDPGTAVAVPEPMTLAAAGDGHARQAAIARFLGATNSVAIISTNTKPSSRFILMGVVAQGRGGAALIAADGKPARPYRVGGRIDDATVLQSVGPRHAVLAASADGSALQRLELPGPAAIAASASRPPAAPPRIDGKNR